MQVTGHPLVDAGLAIAALHCGKSSISELSEDDLKLSVKYLNGQTDPSKSKPGPLNDLKVLSSFWQNNPLAGHNMGKDGQNVPLYRQVLEEVSQGGRIRNGCCQICGRNTIFKDANRSWFPLGASSNGDPCSLPNLSGKFICSACFSAIVLLPLGCKFVGNNPYIFHLTDPEVLCEAARLGFTAVSRQLASKAKGNEALKNKDVKLSGRVALLEVVSGSRLWDASQGGVLTRRLLTGATIIAFSNSGTNAAWYQLHLPAPVLDFFAELDSAQQASVGLLRNKFLNWAKTCEQAEYTDKNTKEKRINPYFDLLCEDVERRRSLAFLVRAIVRSRSFTQQVLQKEEKQVLEIYERVALSKQERFEMLGRIADRINNMEERYRNSFVKRLANMRSKDNLLKMLTEYARSEKTELYISRDELRMLDSESAGEVISLLYLLCMAKD